MTYAHEFYRCEQNANGATVIAATKPVRQRGDVLGSATIQVDLSSPLENVICVEVSHFLGDIAKRPEFEIFQDGTHCTVEDKPETVVVTSGDLCAEVHKNPSSWEIDFRGNNRLLTRSALKCRLMPYLYTIAVEAHRTGVPMMRPMMLEFPDDPACELLDRQYMLGDALLVAPVFEKQAMYRSTCRRAHGLA